MTALHAVSGIDEVQEWIDGFEITHVVGDDGDRAVLELYTDRPGRPQYAVVDRGFDVVDIGLSRDEAFEAVLLEL